MMRASDGLAVFNKIDAFDMRGYSKLGSSQGGADYFPNVTGRVYGYIRGHCSGNLNANGTIFSLRRTENIGSVTKGSGNSIVITLQDDGWTDANIYTKMRVFGFACGSTAAGATLYDNYLFAPFLYGYNTGAREMIIKFVKGNQAESYVIAQSLFFDITLYC
jgi:hypothetical protein